MPLPPRLNPLNQTHCDCLNRVLESTPLALELAKACKDCGMPTDEYIDQLQIQQEQARRLKAMFFPTEP